MRFEKSEFMHLIDKASDEWGPGCVSRSPWLNGKYWTLSRSLAIITFQVILAGSLDKQLSDDASAATYSIVDFDE